MFKKKFKVRIESFGRFSYTVEYAHYRFIPNYHPFCKWKGFCPTLGSDWTEILFNAKEAEDFAKTIKSIEDVKKFYEEDEKRRSQYLRLDREQELNRPYKRKQIL